MVIFSFLTFAVAVWSVDRCVGGGLHRAKQRDYLLTTNPRNNYYPSEKHLLLLKENPVLNDEKSRK
jgi:hypothetical protein